MRGATQISRSDRQILLISIHAPHAGRDFRNRLCHNKGQISIHAPHAGRDSKNA